MEVTFTLNQKRGRDRGVLPATDPEPHPARIPRLSRLMALAIHFDGLIRAGSIPDQATLARVGGVTRSRLTQIMHLLHLAPDIQEELLFLPGGSRIVERTLQPAIRLVPWEDQRRAFALAKRHLGTGAI